MLLHLKSGVLFAADAEISWADVKASMYNLSQSHALTEQALRNMSQSHAESHALTEQALRKLSRIVGKISRSVERLIGYGEVLSAERETELVDAVADEVRSRGAVIQSVEDARVLYPMRKAGKGVEWDRFIFCRNRSAPSIMTVFVIEAKSGVTAADVRTMGTRVARTEEIFRGTMMLKNGTRVIKNVPKNFVEQAEWLLSHLGDYEDVVIKGCIGFFQGGQSQGLEESAFLKGIVTVRRDLPSIYTVRIPFGILAET
jgi:hypothetical protein